MKIAILGTENSHAHAFADLIKNKDKYKDIEIVGVYGNDDAANQRLLDAGLVTYVAKNYDEFLGKVDAILVTARHGDHHYEHALPYIKAGVHAFIDKPMTIDLKKAEELISAAKESGSLITGGSSLKFLDDVKPLKRYADIAKEADKFIGGTVGAPVSVVNDFGGFYFYSQHLVEIMLTIFGTDVKKVYAKCNDKTKNDISCIFDYGNFSVTAHFYDSYYYTASVYTKDGAQSMCTINFTYCYEMELDECFNMIREKKMPETFERLLLPLKILHAVEESYLSEKEVEIK